MLPLVGIEIPLSDWKRSLCKSIDYPAFGDPEPVALPDILAEQMIDFSGFACYETIFILDGPKAATLEISNAAGSVEVFINGETQGIQIKPPYQYDLSSFIRQGKNYLAIEVAIAVKQKRMGIAKNRPCVIGNVRLFGKEPP
jgi:hypothetical protein